MELGANRRRVRFEPLDVQPAPAEPEIAGDYPFNPETGADWPVGKPAVNETGVDEQVLA